MHINELENNVHITDCETSQKAYINLALESHLQMRGE